MDFINDLVELGYLNDDAAYFIDPSFEDAIIGYSEERLVYDFDKMVLSLVKSEGMSEEDALEWIDYNTLRTIPYMGDYKPIILYRIDEFG
jgi:hypothetical protein